MQNKKLRLGITGGIGSGKTLASKYFGKLGFPVIYADDVAKELYRTSSKVKNRLVREFGRGILDDKGNISRGNVRRIIFTGKKNIKRVNAVVHPFVIKEIDRLIKKNKNRIIFVETAIMMESGYSGRMDYVILIYANKALRIKRVRNRDGLSAEKIKKLISLQMDERKKIKLADFIIKNNSTKAELFKSLKSFVKILNSL